MISRRSRLFLAGVLVFMATVVHLLAERAHQMRVRPAGSVRGDQHRGLVYMPLATLAGAAVVLAVAVFRLWSSHQLSSPPAALEAIDEEGGADV